MARHGQEFSGRFAHFPGSPSAATRVSPSPPPPICDSLEFLAECWSSRDTLCPKAEPPKRPLLKIPRLSREMMAAQSYVDRAELGILLMVLRAADAKQDVAESSRMFGE